MKYPRMLLIAVAVGQVSIGHTAVPQGSKRTQQAQLTLKIPAHFPADFTTIATGRLNGPRLNGSVFQLTAVRDKTYSTVAQRDSSTGTIWFMTQVDQRSLSGGTLTFHAKPGHSQQIVTVEKQQDGFRFLDGGRKVMFYQESPKSDDFGHTAANYVHPVRGLDEEVLTQDFPADHRHHHGVFWAWHQLWVGEKRVGDPWVNKDFLPVTTSATVIDSGPVFATLRLTVNWTSPLFTGESDKQSAAVVKEITQIRVFHASSEFQYIDFRISLRALVDGVRIGGAENKKGYSGFTVRVKPPQDMKISDMNGLLSDDHVGTQSTWADVSGRYNATQAVSGLAILSHPSLPEFPPRWLLRHYGMQNVVYPGQNPIKLSRQSPLVLRHRLVIHRGTMQQARIPDHQKAYETFETTTNRRVRVR